MNKRYLNAAGWTLLFVSSLFPFDGISGVATGASATAIALVCGIAAVALFWLGGSNCSGFKRSAGTQ